MLGFFEESVEVTPDPRGVEVDFQRFEFKAACGEGEEREGGGVTTVGRTGGPELEAFYIREGVCELGDVFVRQQKSTAVFR